MRFNNDQPLTLQIYKLRQIFFSKYYNSPISFKLSEHRRSFRGRVLPDIPKSMSSYLLTHFSVAQPPSQSVKISETAPKNIQKRRRREKHFK